MNRYSLIIGLFFIALFSGCKNEGKYRVFEEYKDFNEKSWSRNNELSFTFKIEDANKKYNLFYNVRNMRNYPFYNLYVDYDLLNGEGKSIKKNIQEMYLFDPITGRPDEKSIVGGTTGDIVLHRYMCFSNYSFPEAGEYTFKVKQKMRDYESLPDVVAFGLRIEEVPPKE